MLVGDHVALDALDDPGPQMQIPGVRQSYPSELFGWLGQEAKSYLAVSILDKGSKTPVSAKITIVGPDDRSFTEVAEKGKFVFELPFPVGTTIRGKIEAPGMEDYFFSEETQSSPEKVYTFHLEKQRKVPVEAMIIGGVVAVGLAAYLLAKS